MNIDVCTFKSSISWFKYQHHRWACRKAIANVEAVDERQSVQTLTRDEKTSKRTLEGLREASSRLEEKKASLETEAGTLQERKSEAWLFFLFIGNLWSNRDYSLAWREIDWSTDWLISSKTRAQRAIGWICSHHVRRNLARKTAVIQTNLRLTFSQLEAETNEKLQDCHEKLLSAGLDKRESEKDAKLKETLASLQRLFPGMYPRSNRMDLRLDFF